MRTYLWIRCCGATCVAKLRYFHCCGTLPSGIHRKLQLVQTFCDLPQKQKLIVLPPARHRNSKFANKSTPRTTDLTHTTCLFKEVDTHCKLHEIPHDKLHWWNSVSHYNNLAITACGKSYLKYHNIQPMTTKHVETHLTQSIGELPKRDLDTRQTLLKLELTWCIPFILSRNVSAHIKKITS